MKNLPDKLIFGSTAAKYWFSDFPRTPNDLDYISQTGKTIKGTEYHWAQGFKFVLENNKHSIYVDPDFLYTIKVSHAGWDVKWDKTIYDIRFLKSNGCKLNQELYKLLLKDWERIHYKKSIKLQGTSENLFNSNITRKINHDEVHELVKFYDQPMHTRIRPNLNDVKCSQELWNQLSFEDQIKCALEEIYVFALERYSNFPAKFAFIKAIKQLIIKSTKGYFNLFLIENFFELVYYNKDRYFQFFKQYKEVINE